MRNRSAEYLAEAHLRRLIRDGIWPTNNINLGWVVTENAYLSKTIKGILKTKRERPGKYTHSYQAK